MTKPSDVKPAQVVSANKVEEPKPQPIKRPSAPVRNPAFREHEGLRALQKSLNSQRPARKK